MRRPACMVVVVVSLITICTFVYGADVPGPIPPIPEKFKSIQIIKPDPSVPKNLADFSGEWEGVWKYVGSKKHGPSYGQELRKARLIIYEVSVSKIKLLYGAGDNPRTIYPGRWKDSSVDITDYQGKKYLPVPHPSGIPMQFHLEDGLLKGEQRGNWSIEMKRVK